MSSSSDKTYILAINCGSSSIKTKLFLVTGGKGQFQPVAQASVSNVAAKGKKIKVKVSWESEQGNAGKKLGEDVEEEGDDGDRVDYKDLPPLLLERLTASKKDLNKEDIKYIAHRVVHGGPHKEPIVITNEHTEGLDEMDKLSEFAPLHNHSAVLAIRSCLQALPKHTSVLTFDTLFHQTLPKEVYTYAVPEAEGVVRVPIRKYGMHGLSYTSILSSMAKKLDKPEKEVSIIVAHLGSGGSVCCIRKGKSIDTSMGLTPLEGLVGGTRSGSVDPTLVFHIVQGAGDDAGIPGLKVTRAEAALNKKAGLSALAGTSDFGVITTRMTNPSTCSPEEHESATLAYKVYVDRLMFYVTGYLGKLYGSLPKGEIDGLVFSGGIGEKSAVIREDVASRLAWMGASKIDKDLNDKAGKTDIVSRISEGSDSLQYFVVLTDEEEVCARMTMEQFDL